MFNVFFTLFSDETWTALLHYLYTLSVPQLEHISSLPETEHYVSRVLAHIQINENKKLDYSKIRQCLLLLFPKLVVHKEASVKERTAVRQIENPIQVRRHFKPLPRSCFSNHSFKGRRRSLYQYSHDDLPVTFRQKAMTIDDLALTVDSVRADALALERLSLHPGKSLLPPRPYTAGSLQKESGKPCLQPVLPCELPMLPDLMPESKQARLVKPIETGSKSKRILQAYLGQAAASVDKSGKLLIRSGVDVVRAFALGKQVADTDEFFLNFENTTPWNPYHLSYLRVKPTQSILLLPNLDFFMYLLMVNQNSKASQNGVVMQQFLASFDRFQSSSTTS